VSLGRTGPKQAALPVDVERIGDVEYLRIVITDGFEMVIPLDRVCRYGAGKSGTAGIWLKIEASFGDDSGSHRLEFETTTEPGTGREELLNRLHDSIGSRVVGPRFHGPAGAEPDPAAPETSPPSRVRMNGPERTAVEEPPPPPPPPLKGPSLSAAADSDNWSMCWPLEDTVALSRGELILPPDGA
jgi:hypothetical protein